jgi:AcrR family transcriptional regulator
MNVAQNLFLKHGVSATTIEQITSGADVAKGTFYLYFSSKDDVLAGLRDRYSQELLASINKAVTERAADDSKGKPASWARASVAGYLRSIQLHDLVFLDCCRSRQAARDAIDLRRRGAATATRVGHAGTVGRSSPVHFSRDSRRAARDADGYGLSGTRPKTDNVRSVGTRNRGGVLLSVGSTGDHSADEKPPPWARATRERASD